MKRLDELGVSRTPWTAESGPFVDVVYENKPTMKCGSVCALTGAQRNADAALIAAAPDLYEALRLVLETIEHYGFQPWFKDDPLALAVKCGEKALEKAGGGE